MGDPSRQDGGRLRQRGAVAVGLGILCSRLAGFVRERTIGHFFGLGPYADVFSTALRGPNLLQNLLGEGTVSASFVPIYTRLVRDGRAEDARRFAGAILGLLGAAAAALSLAGVLLARPLVTVLAGGFLGDRASGAAVDRFELTVQCVRWIFPMTGVLVLSAWALGVLNSHRRFFLSYFAPVLWNLAIIAALFGQGFVRRVDDQTLLVGACVGALVGSLLQFGVQLPLVSRLVGFVRPTISTAAPGVREALRAFGPVVMARGAVQFAAWLDTLLASFLAFGATSSLARALNLYLLPTALFSASVAAAELPELASEAEKAEAVRERLDRALKQVAFFNVPTTVAYLGFGFLIVGAVFRTGDFQVGETWLVYLVLSGLTLGLVAGSFSRVLQNAFYALGAAVTPSRTASLRVALSAVLGAGLMLLLDRVALGADLGLDDPSGRLRAGAVGLALGTGLAAWVELAILSRRLASRLQHFALPWLAVGKMVGAASVAALPAGALWAAIPRLHPAAAAALVLPVLGVGYVVLSHLFGVEEGTRWVRRPRWRRGSGR
jgi:putative peptidoglycan lipid II flippase